MSLAMIVVAALGAGPVASDWGQWGKTPQMTAFNDQAPLPSKAAKEWTHVAADRVVASPVVAFGLVWVGSDDGVVSQLDKETGEVKWSWTVPAAANYPACLHCTPTCQCSMVRSTPAVDTDGAVYFGAYDFSIYKLDKAGTMVWNVSTGSAVYGPVTLDLDGMVYAGSFDNHLYAINSTSGDVAWKFNMFSHADCGVAIGSGSNSHVLVTQSNEGGLCDAGHCFVFGVNKHTGELLWKSESTGGPGGGGMVVGNAYFSGSWGRSASSIDMRTGKTNWKVNVDGEVESRPGYLNGIVYITAEESMTLFALNATTGETIWKFAEAKGTVNGSPSIAAGIVYFGANDKYLYAVDAATGRLVFKFETCANVFASAAVADDGMVFIGCNTGTGDRKPGIGAAYAVNPSLHI